MTDGKKMTEDFEDINSKFRRHVTEALDRIEKQLGQILSLLGTQQQVQQQIDELTAQILENNKQIRDSRK